MAAFAVCLISATSLTAFAAEENHPCDSSDPYCLVCDVAGKINALPDADDITINNAASVTNQIHAIDRIKFDLTDEQYDEMLALVNAGADASGGGLDVPIRYVEALEAVKALDAGGFFAIAKKFTAGDDAVDVSGAEVRFKLTRVSSGESQILTLSTLSVPPSGTLSADPSYYSDEASGWTYGYSLPAGVYTITEVSDSGATVNGEPFVTASTSYSVNGSQAAAGNTALFTVEEGETSSIGFYNTRESFEATVGETEHGSLTLTGDGTSGTGFYPYSIVTITVAADEGYSLSNLIIEGVSSGQTYEYSVEADGTLTFYMPEENVLLTATFTEGGAAGGPGATMGEIVGNSADTEFQLMIDDSQLKVTAPTEIVVYMGGDGDFTCPTNAYIENGSIFGVAVSKWTTTSQFGTALTESEFASSDATNAWWMTVAANGAASMDLAVDAASLSADWNMAKSDGDAGEGADCLKLALDGAMKNIDGVDSTSAKALSSVSWHFTAKANAA